MFIDFISVWFFRMISIAVHDNEVEFCLEGCKATYGKRIRLQNQNTTRRKHRSAETRETSRIVEVVQGNEVLKK